MKSVFWLSILAIYYVYFAYPIAMVASRFLRRRIQTPSRDLRLMSDVPKVSIVIAANNEEQVIGRRLENLIALDYPKRKTEIIVASDGSTDTTVEVANRYHDPNVRVLDFTQNRGRAAVQNEGTHVASGEIIVFTDAETLFEGSFLKNLTEYFLNDSTGCVVGNLIYRTEETSVSETEGFYWKLEKKIRNLESELGILATATGACMAVRKELWRELTPIDDCDFTTPLDVILQGYKVVYAPSAVAYDLPPSSIIGELRTRVRQTSKNLVGTLKRWGWRGWIKHPFVSWGLLSHKILRWLTPFFMIGAFLGNLFLFSKEVFYQLTLAFQAIFYLLAFTGLAGELLKKRIPVASSIFSFCIANTGIGIGVVKGLIGKAPAMYEVER